MTEEVEIQPVFARVLLERPVKAQIGSIVIPDQYQKLKAETMGVIRAVGNGCEDWMGGLIGRKVMFARFAGDWLKMPSGKEYYICQEEDILGILKEEYDA